MATAHGAAHDHSHDEHEHHTPTGWRRYLYSTNHKDIGTMYLVFAIFAALIGASFSIIIRLELLHPGVQFFNNADGTPDGHLWNTIVTEGWDDPKLRAERFQRIGSSNVPALCGLRASIKLANDIGMERIERRHRAMADYVLAEMLKRGAESWTSPDAALRCGIVTVNVPPVPRMELESWMWQQHKIRIRGGEPSKLRLSTPYYLPKKDIDRFLATFDEYKRTRKLG